MKKKKFYAIFFVIIFSYSLTSAISIEGRQNTIVFSEIGVIGPGKSVIGMQCVDNELVYILEISNYLTVYNVSQIDNIQQIETVMLYHPHDLEIDKERNLIYATATSGVNIYNCSNPAELQLLSVYKNYTTSTYIQLRNDLVYVGAEEYGLQIVNVSDPSNPLLIGNWTDPIGDVGQVYIKDDFVFIATRIHNVAAPPTYLELKVLNISDPKNITYVSTVNLGGTFNGGAPRAHYGDLIYFNDHAFGLKILNFTNPYDVFIVANYSDLDCFYNDLELMDNDQVLLADDYFGLKVIDCLNLENLYVRGTFETSFRSLRVSVIGSKIYLATLSGGVRILQLGYESLAIGFSPIMMINEFIIATSAYLIISKRKKQ
ncbi:MAG: LVIVD repeat-containing protein [Candidatus Heimdallarchaeota archaeon]